MTTGEKIRDARKKRGLSQEELAHMTNSHTITVSRWERNINRPDLDNLVNIANALGVTVAYLAEGDNGGNADATQSVAPSNTAKTPNRGIASLPSAQETSGRIVYKWGEGKSLELPDTPENREAVMTLIERLERLEILGRNAPIEQESTPAALPASAGVSQTA